MEITAVVPTLCRRTRRTSRSSSARRSAGRLCGRARCPPALEAARRPVASGRSCACAHSSSERREGGREAARGNRASGRSARCSSAAIAGLLPARRVRTAPRVCGACRSRRDVWLQQAGVGVAPRQFVGASVGVGAARAAVLMAMTGSLFVAFVPAIAVALLPRAYFGHRRTVRHARGARSVARRPPRSAWRRSRPAARSRRP